MPQFYISCSLYCLLNAIHCTRRNIKSLAARVFFSVSVCARIFGPNISVSMGTWHMANRMAT